jgi:cephalosporin hydroxylase
MTMRVIIDHAAGELIIERDGVKKSLSLYSDEAFEHLSEEWLKVGWNQKHTYTFTWMGRPIIQLPEDMIRIQELIYALRPDIIIETGIAHGGSLVFYASLCKLLDNGRVIGIDIDIRPHNRAALEAHDLYSYITLVEGSSVDPRVFDSVRSGIGPEDSVLVILDSAHSKQHVLQELELYSGLVTQGSYIVATDGIMRDLSDVPRGSRGWKENNPASAAVDFVARHPEFLHEPPIWLFNESSLRKGVTHWPEGFLRRRSD